MVLVVIPCSLVGCRKDKDEKAAAAGAPSEASIKQSLEGLKPRIDALNAKFKELHKQYDPLPLNLPGFGEVRAKFYGTDEGVGRMGAKVAWLSDRLDAALKSKNAEELKQVSKDINETYGELAQIDQAALELVHQVMPFQRMAAAPPPDELASAFTRVLPSGYEVKGEKDGLEQRLIEFIEDSKKKVDATTWFDLDRVGFAGEGAELDVERSKAQLENLVEILKAYPTVKLKIDAYSDKTAAAAANKKLVTERAQAVDKELVRLGVDASRLDAKGSAVKRPSCAAKDKEECASKSRRAAVHVTAK